MKKLLAEHIPDASKYKAQIALKKCSKTLIETNKYLSVLENTVIAKDEFVNSRYFASNKINKIIASCVEVSLYAKQRIRQLTQQIAEISRVQAGNTKEDGLVRKLAAARVDYYQSLLDLPEPFEETTLGRPFLDSALDKLTHSKNSKEHPPGSMKR